MRRQSSGRDTRCQFSESAGGEEESLNRNAPVSNIVFRADSVACEKSAASSMWIMISARSIAGTSLLAHRKRDGIRGARLHWPRSIDGLVIGRRILMDCMGHR